MRAVGLLQISFVAGCASLLGIDDPKPRSDGSSDAGVDAPDDAQSGTDHLAFSVGDIRIAQNQMVRLHVLHVHMDGSVDDVTSRADTRSADSAVAIVDMGVIRASAQTGATTITAALPPAAPATITVTVTSFACHPVINELTTGDTSGSSTAAADEWVEIYNPCTTMQDVTGWTLVYRAAGMVSGGDTNLMATLEGQMAPGDFRLYAGVGFVGPSDATPWAGPSGTGIMQQTTGSVGLRAGPVTTGPLVDSVAYGAVPPGHPFIETNPTPPMAHGRSASRLPFDGKDDGDATHDGDGAADFVIILTPTPRAPNAP